MGDRAHVVVKEDSEDRGVALYTHWRGSELPSILRSALRRNLRWDDFPYLTRIIFDEMAKGFQGEENGFGISSSAWEDRIIEVNIKEQTVTIQNEIWTFDEFCKSEIGWSCIKESRQHHV